MAYDYQMVHVLDGTIGAIAERRTNHLAVHRTTAIAAVLAAPGQTAAGHGLGLAIARRAAERHGGRLVLNNHPQGGFVATLELPLEPNGTL